LKSQMQTENRLTLDYPMLFFLRLCRRPLLAPGNSKRPPMRRPPVAFPPLWLFPTVSLLLFRCFHLRAPVTALVFPHVFFLLVDPPPPLRLPIRSSAPSIFLAVPLFRRSRGGLRFFAITPPPHSPSGFRLVVGSLIYVEPSIHGSLDRLTSLCSSLSFFSSSFQIFAI